MNSLTARGFEVLKKLKDQKPAASEDIPKTNKSNSISLTSKAQISRALDSTLWSNVQNVGNRAPLQSSAKLDFPTRSHDNEEYGIVSESTPTPDLSQEDLSLVRNAVAEVAKRKIGGNPQISEDDLKSAIDDALGEGLSDFFDVQINDSKAGRSTVSLKQFEISDLGVSDKESLETYAANVRENFNDQKLEPVFNQTDIQSSFDTLSAILDYSGSAVVDDLKAGFKRGKPDEALKEAAKRLDSLELDESSKAKAKEALDDLQSKVDSAKKAFDSNPLSDEISFSFNSGRYDLAFGADDVAETAARTENSDDRSPVYRKF